jgi:hypothetical protein
MTMPLATRAVPGGDDGHGRPRQVLHRRRAAGSGLRDAATPATLLGGALAVAELRWDYDAEAAPFLAMLVLPAVARFKLLQEEV